jgi:hypothetical protein
MQQPQQQGRDLKGQSGSAAHRDATCHSAHGMQKVPRVLQALKLLSRSGTSSLLLHIILLSATTNWQSDFLARLECPSQVTSWCPTSTKAGCGLLGGTPTVAWQTNTAPPQQA